jgi:hypothetical protein
MSTPLDPDYNILKHTDDFGRIFEEFFGPTKVIQRYRALLKSYNEFVINTNLTGKVILHTKSLKKALNDYFREVVKVKIFHKDIVWLNEPKIYAYTAYWFVRRSPIQILDPHSDLINVNILFAVSYFINNLCADSGISHQSKNNKDNIGNFMKNMFYYLKIRSCNPQSMELMAEAFKCGNSCR